MRRANYVYGSAKAGLDGFAGGLADALHGSGVRLLISRPGFVIGRMTEGMTPAPLSSSPQQVAAATARALAKGRRTVWIPWVLGRSIRYAAAAAVRLAQDAAMIVVVGIGADGMAGLSAASRSELQTATVIYGAPRQLGLLDDTVTAERKEWPSPMMPAVQALPVEAPGDLHIVASGDPLMHGIGGTLIRLYGADKVKVLPHVSAITLACARMGWNVHDTEVISLVTAPPHTAVRRGGQAVVLSQNRSTPKALAALLTAHGRGDSEVSVLEQLGGPAERRRDGTARQWADDDIDDLNVIAVRYLPDERIAPLPDDVFAHDGQITKHGIRAVTLVCSTAAAGGASVGRRRRLGQHRRGMVPQLARLQRGGLRTRRAAPPQHRVQCRSLRYQH